ncbi:MAG: UDP-2,3-diacylglucosamine diphosphatase [Lewinellaceae bacterium]|nr:UDP-2,3-diacylglucosamine diphosphatase [Saprospiraceae bacterium]MCB9270804.1 UDP-2,3-diacylglucosamine diphosphatase [Lewinellaceae bacterium]HPG05826.1 UDP-2,3-diacylglucosamine diphosphatase [Saprospiraceae bacterium]HQU52610.1 UDP-2,3-diacylglucosamine diphosphatase [Saprospiraceae bacterium]
MPASQIYFASDFHLGIDARLTSREREKQIVGWLHSIASECAHLYLVGDLFDFWFEYGQVIPKGYTRLLGSLAELVDSGIPVTVFTGNHDLWMFGYLEEELGVIVHREQPIQVQHHGKKFLIGHGDGLGPHDRGYKLLKKIFTNPLAQWSFARLHPNLGMRVAQFWSGKSRKANVQMESFQKLEQEWLFEYACAQQQADPVDYYVFGHRHLPIDAAIPGSNARYINLGDWLHHNSFGIFDGENIRLEFYQTDNRTIYPVSR